jgi:predicted RNase H-like nuclease (RuvC/YqgF family)
MSLKNKKAEDLFREAFERLKVNKPINIASDSKVTQNNIAREAGKHPTALKLDRYPLLVLEIQSYTESQKEEQVSRRKSSDRRSRSDKDKLADYKNQVDKMSSIIEALHNHIETLDDEIEDLKTGVVRKNFGRQT